MNMVTSRSLSAIGSSQAPSVGLLPGRPGDQAVEHVGHAGGEERDQRPAAIAVDQQDHERRNQQHPEDGELIGRREVLHHRRPSARARSRSTAADRFRSGHRLRQLEGVLLDRLHHAGRDRQCGGGIVQMPGRRDPENSRPRRSATRRASCGFCAAMATENPARPQTPGRCAARWRRAGTCYSDRPP